VPDYVIPVLSVFVSSLFFVFVLFQRKQIISYFNRCQLLMQQERSLVVKVNKSNIKIKRFREDNLKLSDKIQTLEKEQSEIKESYSSFKSQVISEVKELEVEKESLESKAVHFETQTQELLKQIGEYASEGKSLRSRYESNFSKEKKLLDELCSSQKHKIEDSNSRLKNYKLKITKLENLVRKTAEVHALKTKQAEQVKRKAKHYQQFYNTVVGQKEMLEERNNNWELALELLASWVLKNQGKSASCADENNLGDLVAQALEVTKQRPLIFDEYSVKENNKNEPS
jgi:chromosome segregation ATPase